MPRAFEPFCWREVFFRLRSLSSLFYAVSQWRWSNQWARENQRVSSLELSDSTSHSFAPRFFLVTPLLDRSSLCCLKQAKGCIMFRPVFQLCFFHSWVQGHFTLGGSPVEPAHFGAKTFTVRVTTSTTISITKWQIKLTNIRYWKIYSKRRICWLAILKSADK